jgi:hypothetical protein
MYPRKVDTEIPTISDPSATTKYRSATGSGRQAGIIGFITLQQSAPTQMTLWGQ